MAAQGKFPGSWVYVASSWRNTVQPSVVKALREEGYKVYDFREPGNGIGFAYDRLVTNHEAMDPMDFIELNQHPKAVGGYERDMNALMTADIVVLVLPCERDAHLELGWAVGAGKQTHILLDNPCKASLMYQMVDFVHPNLQDLIVTLGSAD